MRPGSRPGPARQLIARVGDSRTRLLVLMMLLVAGLTALISVNGAVAALLPVVVVIAVRLGRSPSQLLMPLVFGAHAGSMLALTGTPVNVIVSEAADRLRVRRPSASSSSRSSASRSSSAPSPSSCCSGSGCSRRARPGSCRRDFSRHARTLVDQYGLSDEALDARQLGAVRAWPRSSSRRAPASSASPSSRAWSPTAATSSSSPSSARARTVGPGETVLGGRRRAPAPGHVGRARREPRRPGRARRRRAGARPSPGRAARARRRARRSSSWPAMVVLLATGVVPSVVAGLLAAGAMVLLRVVSPEGAYRAISGRRSCSWPA